MAGGIKGITLMIGGDTSGLAKALSDVNKETNSLQKELREVERGLKFDPKNAELLSQKQKLLNDSIEKTREKLNGLKEAQKIVDEKIKNGVEVDEKEYRALTREIAKTESQLKNLNKAKFEMLKEKFEKFLPIVKGVGAAAVAAGAAVGTMALKAAAAADEINTLSAQTGLSTKTIQEFQYASERIDVSLDTLTGSLKKLTANMASAERGSKTQIEAFEKLGVAYTDNEGSLRNNQEVFNELINALSQVENATERDALAMTLFGKSAQDLNPLILGGKDALKNLAEEANNAGLILSDEALTGANRFNDAMDKIRSLTGGLFTKIGADIAGAFAPAVESAANAFEKFVKNVSLFSDNKKLFENYQLFKEQTDINTAAQLAELEQTEGLVNELYSLTDANGMVTEKDKERADFIANQLYEALGIEIDTNGNVRQSIDEIRTSIDSLIASKKLQIMLQGEEEKYKVALENQTEALKAQEEAYIRLEEANARLNQQQINPAAWEAAFNEQQRAKQAYEEAAKVVEDYSITIDRYETAAALAVQGKTEKAIEYLQNENNYRKVYQTEQLQNFEEIRKARASAFDEAITTARVALDNYNRVQSDANRKNLEEALKNVEETKAAYQRTGQAIINGTVAGVDENISNLNEKLKSLRASLPNEFSGIYDEFKTIGTWIPEGLSRGIELRKGAPKTKLEQMVAESKRAVAGLPGFNVGSPSKWAIQIGQWIDEGLAIGVINKLNYVKKTFSELFTAAEEEAEKLTAEEEFYNAEVLRIEKEKNEAKLAERKAAAKNAEELQKIQSELEKEAEEARTKAYLEELKKKADIAKAQREEIKKAFEGMVSDVESQINDINSKIGSFSGGFQNYDLTEIKKDVSSVFVGTEIYTERAVLANLTKRREELEKFITNIKTLKNIGIDETMIEQIKKLGGENGAILAEALVTATPEQREVFISDFKKIAELSTEAAAEVYSDEIEKTAKNAINVLNELNPDLLKVGETWGDLLGTGLLTRLKESLQNISGILSYTGYSGRRFIHGSDGGTIINNDNTVIQNITATPQTAYEAATETKRAMNDMWHRIIFE